MLAVTSFHKAKRLWAAFPKNGTQHSHQATL